MKKLFLLFLPILLLWGCADAFEQEGVEVKFLNQTGHTIETGSVNGLTIGDLAPDSSTPYLRFDHFGTDTGLPDVAFSGLIANQELGSTNRYYWCGTQKTALPPGRYVVSIELVRTSENELLFDLRFVP